MSTQPTSIKPKTKFVEPSEIPAPTDEQLEDVGLDLDATPEHNANCGLSADSQVNTNVKFNKDLAARYQDALKSYKTQPQGREEPPPPEMPSLDGDFDQHKPYYRLQDRRSLETFCKNDRESPKDPKESTWNYNATKF